MISVYMLRRSLPEQSRDIVGPCIFMASKGELGQTTIQAADLYAHVANHTLSGKPPPQWSLLGKVPAEHFEIDVEYLRQMVAKINAGDPLMP